MAALTKALVATLFLFAGLFPARGLAAQADDFLLLQVVPLLAGLREPAPQQPPEPACEGLGTWEGGTLSLYAINYSRATGADTIFNGDKFILRFDGGPQITTRAEYDICVPEDGRYEFQLYAFADGHTNNGLHLSVEGVIQKALPDHPLAGTEHIYLTKHRWDWHPQWLKKPEDIVQGPVVIAMEKGLRTFTLHKRLIERPLMHQFKLIRLD